MALSGRSGAAIPVPSPVTPPGRATGRAAGLGDPPPCPMSPAPRGAGTRTGGVGDVGQSQSKRGDKDAPRSSTVTATATDGHRGLIQPKKVPNPVWESRSHRELHRELLFSHSRGLLPRHRAELPRVLESRRLRQLREELRGPPSDLEQQLRKRHQRLEEQEQAVPVGPDPEPRPEFLLAREGLRKLPLVEPSARQT
ncbi:protein FAM107B-like isoform X4 [Heliangelus exortis]|uniref:protein FAM107B-like isoform X4 n=1 Tax=Heliangelus exortis TaxID=472823 RepID=UPI003A8FFDCC